MTKNRRHGTGKKAGKQHPKQDSSQKKHHPQHEHKPEHQAISVEKEYAKFQHEFSAHYHKAKNKNDLQAISTLNKIRNEIAPVIKEYQRHPAKIAALKNAIEKGEKILNFLAERKAEKIENKPVQQVKIQVHESHPKHHEHRAHVSEYKKPEHQKHHIPQRHAEHIEKQQAIHHQKQEVHKAPETSHAPEHHGHHPQHEHRAHVSEYKKPEHQTHHLHHGPHEEKNHEHKPEHHEEHKEKQAPKGVIIEKYDIEIDKAKVKVEIRKDDLGIIYYLIIPEISLATQTLLNEIRNELVSITTITMRELIDPEAFASIKKRFMEEATSLIKSKLPNIEKEPQEFLIGKLLQDMLGLGEIEFLINDSALEEVVIASAKEPVRIYSKKYGWLATNIVIKDEETIINYANIIARRVGRQITILSPLLDAHLVTGDRINAVLYPIGTKGNTITIRKFARDPYTMVDLINNKTCDVDTAAILWLAMEYEMNILVSGGTASGKTSFLNACMPFIPPNHRIISIEDTRELMLPEFLYWTPLVTRSPNPEGKGEVSMLDLLVNSLRMRPDRIVLGEMRRREEAMVLFEAMHTGHSVYATVHADSAAETISRLTNPPISIPPNLLRSVHLNVVMFRDRKRGIRRILQIAEFSADKDEAKANIIYRWSPEEDKMLQHSESMKFFEEISRHTGMSQTELNKNLEEKRIIFSWLIKNNLRSLNEFGKIVNLYYKNTDLLRSIMKKNDKSILSRLT